MPLAAREIDCPRAKSAMTPCAARDGQLACDDGGACVGCGQHPADLLTDLVPRYVEARDVLRQAQEAISAHLATAHSEDAGATQPAPPAELEEQG